VTPFPLTKPLKKLADCIGQKLTAAKADGYDDVAFLVFEDGFAMLSIYFGYEAGDGYLEEGCSTKRRAELLAENVAALVTLGLVTPEDAQKYRDEQAAKATEAREAAERKEFERLRAKFEKGERS